MSNEAVEAFNNNNTVLELPKEPAAREGMPLAIDSMMRSEAYWNKLHPEHELVKAKVQAYHAKTYTGRIVSGRYYK